MVPGRRALPAPILGPACGLNAWMPASAGMTE